MDRCPYCGLETGAACWESRSLWDVTTWVWTKPGYTYVMNFRIRKIDAETCIKKFWFPQRFFDLLYDKK